MNQCFCLNLVSHTTGIIGQSGTSNSPFGQMPQVLIVLGVVVLGFLLTISIRGKIARRNAARPSPRDQIKAIKDRAAQVQGVAYVNPNVVEDATSLASQLDFKAERLEQLLAEADVVLQTLGVALNGNSRNSTETRDDLEEIEQVIDASNGEPGSAIKQTNADRRCDLDPLTEAVYELADTGRSSVEIAKRLDEQIGKVELILALRS